MSKSVIIAIGGSVVLVLLAVTYFVWFSGSDLLTRKNELEESIARAQAKLEAQKQSLSAKTNALIKSFPLGASVQDHMRKSSDIVRDTNFLFDEADSSHPELIINAPTSTLINDQRRNINRLLAEWQTKMGISSLSTIDIIQSKKIKEDTGAIRAFIKELSDLLVNLTPANSGLSQEEIDAYLSQLPSVGAVDELLANLQVAIDNPTVNTTTTASVDSQSTNSNVTTSTVVAEQNEVADTQAEIAELQQELTQVEQQIAQSTTPTTTVTTTTVTPVAPTSTPSTSSSTYTPPPRRVITPSTGIIIQPGPPVLIPGIDDH